jgi:hypothetical protein
MQKPPKKICYLMMFAGSLSVALILASLIIGFIMVWTWTFYTNSIVVFIAAIAVNLETLSLNREMEKKYYGKEKTD